MRKRIRAASIHLLLSILVVSCVLLFIYFVAYPSPYFEAMGVGSVLWVIAAVDVIVGPIITLIIFNPLKKNLKYDLMMVAICQVIALGYGFHTAFSARPVFAVFKDDRFYLVSALEISANEQTKAKISFLPFTGPQFFAVDWPEDLEEAKAMVKYTSETRQSILTMPTLYKPLSAFEEKVKSESLPVENLINGQPDREIPQTRALIESHLKDLNLTPKDVVFIPLQGKGHDMSVLVRASDLQILDVVPVHPWARPNT